jgi:hypothetical protein
VDLARRHCGGNARHPHFHLVMVELVGRLSNP